MEETAAFWRRCPKCKTGHIETGYGLMGGGIGPYEFCDADDCDFFVKEQDADERGTREGGERP